MMRTRFARLGGLLGAAAPAEQMLDQQIKLAVDKQLQGKSLMKKEKDPVDLYVGYQVGVQQEHELNAYGSPGWRFGGGMA
ncbi:MAG TPA: hypothetical protein VNR40_04710 [Steroidobacter sp.]|nr:hypothetical protein [Steroidobacter sp.]